MVAFIREFISKSGYPPSIREIGEAVDISSTSVVNYNLKALEKLETVQFPEVSGC
jgi:repressor LexA